MYALEVGHVRDHDAKQIVEFTRHQVALHHLRYVANGILERGQLTFHLAVQAYLHKYVAGQAGLVLAHERDIASYHSGFFQRPHAPEPGRFGQADMLSELHIADTPVFLQSFEN